MGTAEDYREFERDGTRGISEIYSSWALGVASDPEVVALIDRLPVRKRQPNLVFTAARVCGVPDLPWGEVRPVLVERWPQVTAVALSHATQTNEAARCATLLPVLAALPQPLALLEVGASAGLCLYPDRYAYRWGDGPVLGESSVLIECAVSGDVPVPQALPTVVARRGIDLHPLDVSSDDDVAWLEALVWPEHEHRRRRLRAAVDIVRADPPTIMTGDLDEQLDAAVAAMPADATVVVFHSAVLGYLDRAGRQRFADHVSSLPVTWLSNESPDVVPGVEVPPVLPGRFLLLRDRVPVAWTGPHGQSLDWLPT